ncbi:MAG: class I SAM-dependent methyltransferase [Nannocystaceae bacterium]|nr:class I SAM-dependent methyltransferase [Myxococcales bacterium]
MGKPSKSRRERHKAAKPAGPPIATTQSIHALYQRAVQAPEADVEFFTKVFTEQRGRAPLRMREDFCGTALLSVEWCKSKRGRSAVGVDLCAKTLQWGQEHNLKGSGVEERVELVEADVRTAELDPVDLTCAMNFSYCVFKTRAALLEYFKAARKGLVDDGLFICELFGGMEAIQEVEDLREIDDDEGVPFTYVWEQAAYNPINHHTLCHIHFVFKDRSRIDRAFTYDWRLWSIPEVRELLLEAGFRDVRVYWEEVEDEDESDDDDDQLEGTGEFVEKTEVENQESWLVYIAAFV